MGEAREVDLNVASRTGGFAHTTLLAEILQPEPLGPLLFVNHLPSWQLTFEHEREPQTVAAARFVEELIGRRGMHVVPRRRLRRRPRHGGRALLVRSSVSGGHERVLQ